MAEGLQITGMAGRSRAARPRGMDFFTLPPSTSARDMTAVTRGSRHEDDLISGRVPHCSFIDDFGSAK
jgi:hypothetical protein